MVQARVEKQTSTNSRCCIRHSTCSCFPAISSPAGYYSDVMEFSRAFQSQCRDRLGAEMQSQWQFKLFCVWSVNQTAWFCHGNGVLEYTVAVLQSAAVGDKIPATKQDKQSFLGWICNSCYFSEWIFKGRLKQFFVFKIWCHPVVKVT